MHYFRDASRLYRERNQMEMISYHRGNITRPADARTVFDLCSERRFPDQTPSAIRSLSATI
jgi:hypothetical protein